MEDLARRLEMEEAERGPLDGDSALAWWQAEDADLRVFARGSREGTHARLWFDAERGVVYFDQVNR